MTDTDAATLLAFDRFTLDLADERLCGPDGPIHIGNKAFRVLATLAEAPGRLVTKDQLFESVWDGTIVSESALTSVIKELRRALGDQSKTPRLIESVYGRGYRFIGEVGLASHTAPPPPALAPVHFVPRRAAAGQSAPEVGSRPLVSRRQAIIAGGAGLAVAAGAGLWTAGVVGPAAAAANSVAVFPFKPLDGPAQTYFAQGLSEEIGVELAGNPALKVMAPTSVAFALAEDKTPAEAAKRLGVGLILSGSVQRDAEQMRITCELIDAANGYTMWADRFDRPAGDVLDVQRKIAWQVADVVEVRAVGGRGTSQGTAGGTRNAAAYDAYLRGLAQFEQTRGELSMKAAMQLFESALAFDPGYARPMANLAMGNATLGMFYSNSSALVADRMAAALKYAQAAFERAPDLALVHSVLGFVTVAARFDYRAARPHFERGRELGHGIAANQAYYASFAAQTGQADAAKAAIDRALALDPLNASRRRNALQIALLNHDFEGALKRAGDASALEPKMSLFNAFKGDALIMLRRYDDARDAYAAEPEDMFGWTGRAIAHFHLNEQADARRWYDRLIERFGSSASYQQAQILAQWGDLGGAGKALDAAWRAADTGLTSLYRDPLLIPVKDQPAYRALVEKIRFV